MKTRITQDLGKKTLTEHLNSRKILLLRYQVRLQHYWVRLQNVLGATRYGWVWYDRD